MQTKKGFVVNAAAWDYLYFMFSAVTEPVHQPNDDYYYEDLDDIYE